MYIVRIQRNKYNYKAKYKWREKIKQWNHIKNFSKALETRCNIFMRIYQNLLYARAPENVHVHVTKPCNILIKPFLKKPKRGMNILRHWLYWRREWGRKIKRIEGKVWILGSPIIQQFGTLFLISESRKAYPVFLLSIFC